MNKYFLSTLVFFILYVLGARAEQGTEKHFIGTIDKKLKVYLRLTQTGDSVYGDYIYLSQGKPISLRGAYKRNHFVIYEFSDANYQTMSGKFEGDMSGDTMKGIWRSMASPDVGHHCVFTRSGSTLRHIATKERLLKPYETPDSVVMVDSYFPMLTQLKNYETSRAVNQFLDSRLRSFKYDGKMPNWDNPNDSLGWFSEASYRLLYITDDVASFSIDIAEYTGGAHPTYGTLYIMIDLNTGKQLSIKDCINTKYLRQLNALIEKAASACAMPDIATANCLHVSPDDMSFSISAEGLKLFVDQCYSHASLACAFIEIPLPNIKKFLKTNGPCKELR